MPDVDDAITLITDPANVSRLGLTRPEQHFAVNRTKVIKTLRNAGAGKAEARELALEALAKVNGGAELHASRGTPAAGGRGEATEEHWWVPKEAVRF